MNFRLLSCALLPIAFTVACGGTASTSDDGGDGDSTGGGDGDGDLAGDGDGGDTPTPGDGDGDSDPPPTAIMGSCSDDSDCVAASITNGPCYTPGCAFPMAASQADVANNEYLVPWNGTMAPMVSDECRFAGTGGDVACLRACPVPPTCVHAYCDEGRCAVNATQDGSDCTDPGAGTGGGSSAACRELDAARVEALDAARACVVGGIIVECQGGTVPDECGCPVPINDNAPELAQAAQDAYLAWNEVCEPPMVCELIDCGGGLNTSCKSDGGVEGVCSF